MLNTLRIKDLTFPNNIIQGPLAGVSCAPFRELTWRFSQPAYTCTEMISCKTLIHQNVTKQKRFISKDPAEGPVCFQLSSNNAAELALGVQIVTQHGADLIDLNCGCPVKKIRHKDAGSKLLSTPAKLQQMIEVMRANTDIPVGVKIRVDGNSTDNFNSDIAQAIRDGGADFVVVHGRHWSENYDTLCHYKQIEFFVNELNIPVIGNGDISNVTSLQKMFSTGCAGVMIARAGVGQPWLIKQLMSEFKNDKFVKPDIKCIAKLFIEHAEKLSALLDNEFFAILQMRKLAKYYARGLERKVEFVEAINRAIHLSDLRLIADKYFKI